MNRFIYGFLFAWIDLADAIVNVLMFGTYNPCLAMRFACWDAMRYIKRSKK